jgi:hypothetical protein
MKNVGVKTRWGIYVKYFDGTETKYWYKSERKRNKELRGFVKEAGPNKMIWSALKCSD